MNGPRVLHVEQLDTAYGQTQILRGVSFEVGPREIVAILGRNGAGKTTLLRSIMGLTPARSGRVDFKARDITGLPTYEIAALPAAVNSVYCVDAALPAVPIDSRTVAVNAE